MKQTKLFSTLILPAMLIAAVLSGSSSAALASANTAQLNGKGPHQFFKLSPKLTADDYLARTVIFKMNPKFRQYCTEQGIELSRLNEFFQALGVTSVKKMFPLHYAPETKYDRHGQELVDLSLDYTITYTANVSVEDAINYLYQQGAFVEFAVPHYVDHIFSTPNDPNFSSQTFMNRIQATTGWNTTTGNPNTIIGVVDSGFDMTHEDLASKIYYNPGEAPPLDNNGIDDDKDGFIDNYKGWDTGMNDNNPDYSTVQDPGNRTHGTHCAGLAGGATNNGKGIAGVSYDCKLLFVKISNDATKSLPGGMAGIIYAADHGASIISCSWGSVVPANPFLQQIIDYAVINKGSLVLAAAGNNGINEDAMPASLDHVISVAATNSTDDKRALFGSNAGSDYSVNVDVCAPGLGILSTFPPNTYASQDGTSMACPIAAGVAAMIKVMNPTYTGLQVGEHLKATTDDVYAANPNPTYKGKLGTGRVNLAKAVGPVTTPSVLMSAKTSTDGNDNVYLIGDVISYTCTFTNYLATTTAATTAVLSLATATNDVTITSSTATLPSGIATLGTANNSSTPFKMKINSTATPNEVIYLKLTTTTGTKVNIQYFTETVNVDYLNIGVNDVIVSVPSNSRIGWVGTFETGGGLGFLYNSINLMYEGGFMVGVSSSQVSDLDRGLTKQHYGTDTDFVKQVAVTRPTTVSQPANADWESTGTFDDSGTLNKIGITVDHREYAWSSAPDRKYVIFEYTIHNNSGNTLSNLYAGIFQDWDIDGNNTSNKNFAATDVTNRMGYTWRDTVSKIYAGAKLLSHNGGFNNYCLDNDSTSGGIGSNGGYSTAKKYTMLSTNRAKAGNVKGNDVLDVTSTGPFTINAGASIKVAFALFAGDNLTDIQTTVAAAQAKYDGFTAINELQSISDNVLSVYPNPSSNTTTIDLNLLKNTSVDLKVLDVLGHEVKVIANGLYTAGAHRFVMDVSSMPVGIYYYQLRTDEGTLTKKLLISK